MRINTMNPLGTHAINGYGNYRGTQPMTDEQIRAVAPSVFALDKHESRSKRYTYIPTVDVLAGLRREGFEVFSAQQSRCRDEGKREHTKHMIRLRHRSTIEQAARVGDSVNEIIMRNSHDGTCAHEMFLGCFRWVCANGLVAGDLVDSVKVKHSGNVIGEVVEGAFRILSHFERVDASRDAMRALQLTDGQQVAFANAALAMRYPDKQASEIVVRADQVLAPKRFEDRQGDLWTTFNRVQEHLVRGGDRGMQVVEANGRRQVRRATTRAVNGIDGNVALNRGLWVLAEQMGKLVRGESVAA